MGRTGDQFSGYTGRGVIVGIIDSGIDFRHQSLRKADGTSRVLKIWDQTLTALTAEGGPGPIADPSIAATPTPLGYGVEYDQRQINETLTEATPVLPVRHVDQDGHGTHVAGISAGDGSQKGHCHGIYRYIGVAPEADIMAVRLWGLTKGDTNAPATPNNVIVDAVRYLFNEAKVANKSLVVNLSLGRFTEKMDGTAANSQAIDTVLKNNSGGRAIVFSAGNEGALGFHAADTVAVGAGNELHLTFTVFPQDTKPRQLVVTYTGANLQAQLTSPVSGAAGVLAYAPVGPAQNSPTANGGGLVSILNKANNIGISIAPPAGGSNTAGTWTLDLRNTGAAPTPINAFCLYGSSHDQKSPRFTSSVTTRSTLNEYATGFESLAIGSYHEGGRLSDFSGRGPTLDARPGAKPKPELAGPGEDIASAGIAKDRGGCQRCCCDCCRDFYVDMSGTSMSAPHVSGVIALMLHKNPTLTHVQIRDLLTGNTAPKPADSTPDEDAGWGAGRLDAKKVVDAVAQVNPPVAPPAAAAVRGIAPLAQLQDRMLGTDRGPTLKALVEKYGAEVWMLIQSNRRVATIWHRCKGPVWVRLALKAVQTPERALHLDVDGMNLRDSLLRFASALKRFGSPALRDDVQAWEPEIARIQDGMSLHAIIDALGNRSRTA